jgi:hypothetical protein
LWAARALGEDISRSAPKLTTERIELWNKFLPEDPTPFTYEETWNHICRNAQREDRGEQQRSLRHGPDSAILWTFEQLGALFLWQCRNPERFSNKPLFDYLCFRNSEYRRPRQKPVVKRGKDEALPRLLERDFAGIGPTLLAAITADHPFMGTAADLLELLKSVNGVVEEDGAGLHRKRDWTAEYIAEWLDDNWVKVEATFDAKRGIDSLDRTVFSIKPSRLIPFEKLREALSTFPEIALPMFSVMQDALARLFTLAYWGDRAASVAAKKTLEELLPRSNRHPITNHLPKIIEIFSRKRNGIVKSDAKIKQVHPGLTEAKRVKMLSVLYSEDPGTIRDAIRDQSEKAFLVQRLSKYLPVSETQVKRAVTATRCKSA